MNSRVLKNFASKIRASPSSSTGTPSSSKANRPILPSGLVGCRRIIISAAVNLLLNTATFLLDAVLHRKTRTVFPPSVVGIFASFLALGTTIVDISHWRKEGGNGIKTRPKVRSIAMHTAVFLAITSVISSLIIITLESTDEHKIYFDLPPLQNAGVIVLSSLAVGSNTVLAAFSTHLTWSPAHRAARSFMLGTSILQFVVGALVIANNWLPWAVGVELPRLPSSSIFAVHQYAGALEISTAILSFALCTAIRESNRIDRHFTGIIRFHVLFSGLIALLVVILFIISMRDFFSRSMRTLYERVTLASNPILDGTAIILFAVSFVCATYLQELPKSNLRVELLDLLSLTDRQRDAYARLIDRHGMGVPGAPSGAAAMSIMMAYVGSSLPNMACTVLRVYKIKNKEDSQSESAAASHIWGDRAWSQLDEEKMILRPEPKVISDQLDPVTTSATSPTLSKTQLKRLARKQATAAARGETLALAELQDSNKGAQFTPLDDEFRSQLETTEALVLLTTISDFDLTSSIKGWTGKVLTRTLGSKSYFKPLCVRLGLLATHFPFRESTFFCSATRRPVARSAAVLRAVDRWNRNRDPGTRCAVLLNPTYQHEAIQRSIVPSGWRPSPLAPSHIIDLTPYKNMTTAEYLKAIKYRDQEAAFKKAGGEVIETTTFTEEECKEVMALWRKIAAKRASSGDAAVLVTPDETFIKQLGTGGTGDRSLMFLRVGGQTVASCVLFRLGDTITSDVQGLDHELARPLKAYFVMMQHVIRIALREGRSFVDFGPTTAKPKTDIGCKSVPLIGAMCAVSPVLSLAIGIAAKTTVKDISAE